MDSKKRGKLCIPLPEEKVLDLLLKVKPTDEMPSRRKHSNKKVNAKPSRKKRKSR